MPIIGFNFKGMEAKKTEEVAGAIKVNSNMNITDIKEQDLQLIDKKGLLIDFEFKINYINEKNKSIGYINVDGNVVFVGDEHEKILKDWKKDKSLPEDIRFQVIRIVSDKCSKKAIILSDDIQLPPPPLIIPQARQENKK